MRQPHASLSPTFDMYTSPVLDGSWKIMNYIPKDFSQLSKLRLSPHGDTKISKQIPARRTRLFNKEKATFESLKNNISPLMYLVSNSQFTFKVTRLMAGR